MGKHRLAILLMLFLAGCGTGPGGRHGPPVGVPAAEPGGARAVSAGSDSLVEQIDRQLRETRAALHLSPRQQVLWDVYQDRVERLVADQMRVDLNTPVRRDALAEIDAKVETVRNRLTAMEDIAKAAQALYLVLDAAQKEIADRRLAGTVPALYSGFVGHVDPRSGPPMPNRGRPDGAGERRPPGGW